MAVDKETQLTGDPRRSTDSSHSAEAGNHPPQLADEKLDKELSEGSASDKETAGEPATKSAPQQWQTADIPNGGFKAWLQVIGAFMVFFNTWGILNTFGVYQTYYESGQLFKASSSDISWIGSIQAYMVLVGGLLSGPLYDRGYLRYLLAGGAFLIVFGHMMLSLCTTFWQALLAQGFCVGLGAGCIFVPALAVVPGYFNTRLGLALGLAASGSSFGGIIYPIVFYRLVGEIGFPWSVRVLGFMVLATVSIPIVCTRMRFKPAKARAILDWSAFLDGYYITFTVGCSIGFIGLYIMLFYLSYNGQERGITDASLSFYLVAILNAGSMFGRTIPNWLSDKIGGFNLIIPGAVLVAILNFSMISVHNVGGIVVVALLFGFFSGVFIALPPVIFVQLTQDKSKIGTRLGMGFAILGFGALIGGPGGGGVLGYGDELHWTALWSFAGATGLASAAIFALVRIWRYGPNLMIKA